MEREPKGETRERPNIEIDIVKEQILYNTFITRLRSDNHGSLEPVDAWAMFRLQCDAKMVQNEIGFYTFVHSPGHGVFFVFTLPAGVRKKSPTAATLVRDMLNNCVWGTCACTGGSWRGWRARPPGNPRNP